MQFERRVGAAHLRALEDVFGDVNPLHADPTAAERAGFKRPIAHGAILVCLLSEIIGMRLGTETPVFCGLEILFERPFYQDDVLTFDVEPRHQSAGLNATAYSFTVFGGGQRVARGEFLVKEPRAVSAQATRPSSA